MTRRLLLSYLTITAFVLLILEIPLAVTFARSEHDRLTADVERDARVLATFAEDTLEGRASADLQQYADEYRDRTDGRVVIVGADGISRADSDREVGRDFSTRPEFEAALAGRVADGTRASETLGEEFLYVSVPVASSGEVFGAVRISYPTAQLDRRVRRNWLSLGALAVVVLAAVVVVGFVLARSVTRPIRALGRAADALAGGNLQARAPTDAGPPEVRALARQFNDMAARLEELVNAQRAFVADASHELRTPLTALRLRMENLETAAPGELRIDVEAASAEVARLGRLVEGLLALARTEGAARTHTVVDLTAEAAERVETWHALAEEQGVTLSLESAGDTEASTVDNGAAQVLDNLLANALEVAPRGSAIRVRVVGAGDTVELHVVDEGPGLSDDERRRAFARFWRGPGAESGRGSGLGLAIVARVAAASGGTAALQAAPGTGVDAVVRFPAAAAIRGVPNRT